MQEKVASLDSLRLSLQQQETSSVEAARALAAAKTQADELSAALCEKEAALVELEEDMEARAGEKMDALQTELTNAISEKVAWLDEMRVAHADRREVSHE